MYLNVFEYNICLLLHRLNLHSDRTLQPVRQKFFAVSDEEVHLGGYQSLSDDRCDPNVIKLSFDYNFRHDHVVPSPDYEFPNEHVFDGCLGASQSTVHVS